MQTGAARLVLASSSPRRARLLAEAGISFIVEPSSADETFDDECKPVENARRIALVKAEPVAVRFPGSPVVAADTIVVLDGEVIGKPKDEVDAVAMLERLSGREHQVVTGVALIHLDRAIRWSSSEVSRVRFMTVSRREIGEYVAGGEPMDKAGAYAIQGGAAKWIEGYTGSFTNIVGLPMEKMTEALASFGYLADGDAAPCR